MFAGLPSSARAAAARSRSARPASSSELASVLRRWANAAWATRRTDSSSPSQDRSPPEGDERRVDVRRRPEARPRDRVEARSLGGELQDDRDRAVVLRPRPGEEAVGDLALDHHAPALDGRARGEALDDERGGDVVGQVGDELRRRRVERRGQEVKRVSEDELDVRRARPARSRRTGSRLRSSSIACTRRTRAARYVGEHAQARADLEDDVLRAERRQPPDHVEDVLVDEPVLAELAFRARAHGRPKRPAAFASICASRVRDVVAARLRQRQRACA